MKPENIIVGQEYIWMPGGNLETAQRLKVKATEKPYQAQGGVEVAQRGVLPLREVWPTLSDRPWYCPVQIVRTQKAENIPVSEMFPQATTD